MPVMIALVLAAAFAAGCSSPSKEIKGSCATVVKECQDVANGDDVTVIVSGWPVSGLVFDDEVAITDGGEHGPSVYVHLKDGQDGAGVVGRTTFKGTLRTDMIFTDAIYLKDAEIVR